MGKNSPVLDVDVENEQIVLATLIKDPGVLRAEAPRIQPETFVSPRHQAIMTALREIVRAGGSYAADTVVELAAGAVTLKYLTTIDENFDAVPPENLPIHLARLEASRTKAGAAETFAEIYEGMEDPHVPLEALEGMAGDFLRRLRSGRSQSGLGRGRAYLDAWLEDLRVMREDRSEHFVPLQFSALDSVLFEGFKRGNLTVVAARPGMGKTTFCSNVTLRQKLAGRKVLSVPAESGRDAVFEQMLCARARVSSAKLIKTPHLLTDMELFQLKRAGREILDDGDLVIDDRIFTLDALEARVEGERFDLVVLDLFEYLVPGEKKSDVITDALRRVRGMGQKHGFHTVVVQQIRRIKRARNPRPNLHELKNSGGYEEVADLVLLLHRNKYYDRDAEDDVLEVKLAKQRRGPMNVNVGFEFDVGICRVGKNDQSFVGATDLEVVLKELEEKPKERE